MKQQDKHGHSELIWKVTQILAKIIFFQLLLSFAASPVV